MAKRISYRYEALDNKSFAYLAPEIIDCGAIVTINPNDKSFVAQIDEAQYGTADDPLRSIGRIIDDNALNFHITFLDNVDFTEQIDSLKDDLEQAKKDLEQARKDKNYYCESYLGEIDRVSGIKKQIESIGVLLALIHKS